MVTSRRPYMPRSALGRVMVAAVLGLIASTMALLAGFYYVAAQAGWDVAAVVYLAITLPAVWWLNPTDTQHKARDEDPTRPVVDVILLAASVASLVALGVVIVRASRSNGPLELALTLIAIISVVLSWALVHVTYMLRYASLYYTEPVGGVDFNQDENPCYADFAYLAFTIGMTFQVSDTALRSRAIRSAALRHALLSYLFGTVILATTVNFVAGLAH
jgi:uncharacterized membrane protein